MLIASTSALRKGGFSPQGGGRASPLGKAPAPLPSPSPATHKPELPAFFLAVPESGGEVARQGSFWVELP